MIALLRCGANFFRADGDIGPEFNGIIGRLTDLLQYSNDPPISRPGCWAYPDSKYTMSPSKQ
jgi:hypothetical protein